ncbi:MAG TPA: hypothetical protein PLW48_00965 [Alphaproteobacteria bacterium]|nr:hypothetical protein [Alphaproteobacteria bacterium]
MTNAPTPPLHDEKNPDPWRALLLDRSTFIGEGVKTALMRNNASRSRQFLLPIVRPLARLTIGITQLLRIILPRRMTSPRALHAIICWGMKTFVSRDANYLILRHFNIGSQILGFLNRNLAGGALSAHPLLPRKIADVGNNTFIQHDLNIYNFIINLNDYLRGNQKTISALPLEKIDFSPIRPFDQEFEPLPDKWHNFLDLQSAIELYTPMFGLLLSDDDFWRASNSLQLDETIATYVAQLFGRPEILSVVNNRHPMIPLSTFEAGFRLMLHGYDAENLYGFINAMKESAGHDDAALQAISGY